MRVVRLLLVFGLAGGLSALGSLAHAEHCDGQPHPPAVPDDYPCSTPAPPTPEPTPEPEPEPEPEPQPEPQPEPEPAPPAPAPAAPTRTPTPTPFPLEDPGPAGTPEITVPGAVFDDLDEESLDVAEPANTASVWIFGFLVGLIVGGFIGRASWGLSRRRRRQQIFG